MCGRSLLNSLALAVTLLQSAMCCPFLDRMGALQRAKGNARLRPTRHRALLSSDIDSGPTEVVLSLVDGAEGGCIVSLGSLQPAYSTCLQYSADGQELVLAYTVEESPEGAPLLNGALVGLDFLAQHNLTSGWLALAVPPPGNLSMVGANAVLALLTPAGPQVRLRFMPTEQPFDATEGQPGFLYDSDNTLRAGLAGGALVSTFSILLEPGAATRDLLIDFGPLTTALPEPGLSLIATTINTTLGAALGAASIATGPVINPEGEGAAPGAASSCALEIGGRTLQFKDCRDVGSIDSPYELLFSLEGGTATVGARGSTSGWLGVALGDVGMLNANAVFAAPCASCPTGATPLTALLAGYSPRQFQAASVAFSEVQAERQGGEMRLAFSFPWPAGAGSLGIMCGRGPARGASASGELTELLMHSTIPNLVMLNADGTAEI